jgi:hypothetical protein
MQHKMNRKRQLSRCGFHTTASEPLLLFVAAVFVSETNTKPSEVQNSFPRRTTSSSSHRRPAIAMQPDFSSTSYKSGHVLLPDLSSLKMFFQSQPSIFGTIMSVFGIILTPFLEIISTVQCAFHKVFSCPCSRIIYVPSDTFLLTTTVIIILALLYALIIAARHGYTDRIIHPRWQPKVLKRMEVTVSANKRLPIMKRFFGGGEVETRGRTTSSERPTSERPGSRPGSQERRVGREDPGIQRRK